MTQEVSVSSSKLPAIFMEEIFPKIGEKVFEVVASILIQYLLSKSIPSMKEYINQLSNTMVR